MICYLRTGAFLAVIAVLAAAFVAAWWMISAAASNLSEIVKQAEEGKRLDRVLVMSKTWWEGRGPLKKELARDLIAGRLTLEEAIKRFRDHRPAPARGARQEGDLDGFCPLPGDTEDERFGRMLLDVVIFEEWQSNPSRPSETARRLQEEFRLLLAAAERAK